MSVNIPFAACTLDDSPTSASTDSSGDGPDRSLPSQWFRDERIFHIERRAIFSKLWLLSTHVSRFEKAGDYLKLEIAGYPYFVIKTKEGGYNAFHNVCRHRAFPLIHKETGSSTILGCKYHGWSYSSSTGALIKAPKFVGSSSTFKMEDNGLFKIHTHVTDSGFIFINLDASPLPPKDIPTPGREELTSDSKSTSGSDSSGWRTPSEDDGPAVDISIVGEELELELKATTGADEDVVDTPPKGATMPPAAVQLHEYTIPFKEHFGTLPSEWDGFHPEEYEYAYSWTRNGPYNWKTFMDGYQECYHCNIAHPGFAKSLALETYAVAAKTNYARHTAQNKTGPNSLRPVGAKENDTPPTFTFIFPTCGVTVTETMWYMMRAVPVSAVETRMEYDVFRRKTVPMPELRSYMEFYEQVEDEDFLLCCATQRNLNTGIYSRGFLHPEKELGVLFYQSRVREFVENHLAREKSMGREWNPAQPASQIEASGVGCLEGGMKDIVCQSLGPEMLW